MISITTPSHRRLRSLISLSSSTCPLVGPACMHHCLCLGSSNLGQGQGAGCWWHHARCRPTPSQPAGEPVGELICVVTEWGPAWLPARPPAGLPSKLGSSRRQGHRPVSQELYANEAARKSDQLCFLLLLASTCNLGLSLSISVSYSRPSAAHNVRLLLSGCSGVWCVMVCQCGCGLHAVLWCISL